MYGFPALHRKLRWTQHSFAKDETHTQPASNASCFPFSAVYVGAEHNIYSLAQDERHAQPVSTDSSFPSPSALKNVSRPSEEAAQVSRIQKVDTMHARGHTDGTCWDCFSFLATGKTASISDFRAGVPDTEAPAAVTSPLHHKFLHIRQNRTHSSLGKRFPWLLINLKDESRGLLETRALISVEIIHAAVSGWDLTPGVPFPNLTPPHNDNLTQNAERNVKRKTFVTFVVVRNISVFCAKAQTKR